MLVEQGPDWFGFLHLTFQEFCARAIVHRSGDATRLIARYWDHLDWREVWPLYALAVQTDAAKLEHLFQTILASGDDLDAQLFRPQLACLRLAGLGGAPLPSTLAPVLDWATNVLKGVAGYPLLEIMDRLAAWERRLTAGLRSAAFALRSAAFYRLGDAQDSVRQAAEQALSGGMHEAAVGEREVRDERLARLADLADDDSHVRRAAADMLAAAVGDEEVRAALLARLATMPRPCARRRFRRWRGRGGRAEGS